MRTNVLITAPLDLDAWTVSAARPDIALRRPLSEIVDAALKASGRSEHTRRSYYSAILLLLQFIDRERGDRIPKDLAVDWRPFVTYARDGLRKIWSIHPPAAVLRLVDASLVDAFKDWREREGDSVNAVMLRMAAARTFLSVAYRENVLTHEQAQMLGLRPYRAKQKHDDQPVGRRLTPEEVRRLLAACDRRMVKGARDHAILSVMLYLGLRREETAGLRIENCRPEGDLWWCVLRGKGQKTRRVKVHPELLVSLVDWLTRSNRGFDSQGWLFLSVNKGDRVFDRPIDGSAIGRLVAEYGQRSGLAPRRGKNRLSPHDLRRTCARNSFDHGADLLLIRAMLGHSDPKTTARYIGALEDDQHTAVDFIKY